jgi:hypothetical protein
MKWRHNQCGQEVMKGKAAMFAEYLATVYTQHDDLNDNEKERQLPENSSIIPEVKYLTVKEVQNEIACLNQEKPSALTE